MENVAFHVWDLKHDPVERYQERMTVASHPLYESWVRNLGFKYNDMDHTSTLGHMMPAVVSATAEINIDSNYRALPIKELAGLEIPFTEATNKILKWNMSCPKAKVTLYLDNKIEVSASNEFECLFTCNKVLHILYAFGVHLFKSTTAPEPIVARFKELKAIHWMDVADRFAHNLFMFVPKQESSFRSRKHATANVWILHHNRRDNVPIKVTTQKSVRVPTCNCVAVTFTCQRRTEPMVISRNDIYFVFQELATAIAQWKKESS